MTVFEQEEKEGENPWKALPHHDVTFISPKPTLADDRGITFMPVVCQIFFFQLTERKKQVKEATRIEERERTEKRTRLMKGNPRKKKNNRKIT